MSPFEETDLYAENGRLRHSYIYNAAITSLTRPDTTLGGIGIVFDSEPQFLSMLQDALPRDGQGAILEGAEGMPIPYAPPPPPPAYYYPVACPPGTYWQGNACVPVPPPPPPAPGIGIFLPPIQIGR